MLRQHGKKSSSSSGSGSGASHPSSSSTTSTTPLIPRTPDTEKELRNRKRGRPAREKKETAPVSSRSQASSSASASTESDNPLKEKTTGEREEVGEEGDEEMVLSKQSRRTQWIVLAVLSGACAACNGVFAKLTTTELTTKFATWIANGIGLGNGEKGVEVVVRGMFFALNLIFNGVMWTLFTRALARGTSTTQVSILNTSSNFILTALLGYIIFSESLPPLWWCGAALLIAGNVVIGRREEKDPAVERGEVRVVAQGFGDEEDALLPGRGGLGGGGIELSDEILKVGGNAEGEEDDELDFGADVEVEREEVLIVGK